ncbi:hypothetical protein JCM6882_003095 [Rhodosporidiobolus microsporus]
MSTTPCAPEHQKLAWSGHKVLCGGPPNACYLPPLTDYERGVLLKRQNELWTVVGGEKKMTLLQHLEARKLWTESLPSLLDILKERDCIISEPRRSRILSLCISQAHDDDGVILSPWCLVANEYEILRKQSLQLIALARNNHLSAPLLDISHPSIDPFRRFNNVLRQALIYGILLQDDHPAVRALRVSRRAFLVRVSGLRIAEFLKEADLPQVQIDVLARERDERTAGGLRVSFPEVHFL